MRQRGRLPKHPVAFFHELHWVAAFLAEFLAVFFVDLRLRQERLVRAAVVAAVAGFVEISVALQFVPDLVHQLGSREGNKKGTSTWSGSVVRIKRPNCKS